MERRHSSPGLGMSRIHAWRDAVPTSLSKVSFAAPYNPALHDRVGSRIATPFRADGTFGTPTCMPRTDFPTKAPPIGRGASIQDLRAVVADHQQQLEALTDKISSLSYRNVDTTQDLLCDRGAPKTRNGLFKNRFDRFTASGAKESDICGVLQEKMHALQDVYESRFQFVEEQLHRDVRDLHKHFTSELNALWVRLSNLARQTVDVAREQDIRQDLYAYVDSSMRHFHSSVRDQMDDLRQEVGAPLHGCRNLMAKDVDQRLQVLERLREKPTVRGSSIANEMRRDIYQDILKEVSEKTQPRLEAHAVRTFGFAQRVINDLRIDASVVLNKSQKCVASMGSLAQRVDRLELALVELQSSLTRGFKGHGTSSQLAHLEHGIGLQNPMAAASQVGYLDDARSTLQVPQQVQEEIDVDGFCAEGAGYSDVASATIPVFRGCAS